jgi:hypothetical protein
MACIPWCQQSILCLHLMKDYGIQTQYKYVDKLPTWVGKFVGVHDGGARKHCKSTLEHVFVVTTMLPTNNLVLVIIC